MTCIPGQYIKKEHCGNHILPLNEHNYAGNQRDRDDSPSGTQRDQACIGAHTHQCIDPIHSDPTLILNRR